MACMTDGGLVDQCSIDLPQGGRDMGPGIMGQGWDYGPRGMMGGGCLILAIGDDGETAAFIDGRLAVLKTELNITDAQKVAWEAYAKSLNNNSETIKSSGG